MAKDHGLWSGAITPDGPPKCTDLRDLSRLSDHRHSLYSLQEGVCVDCDTHVPFKEMEVDHTPLRSEGGTDQPDNLQLLCSGCNRSKDDKMMAR